MDGAHSPDAQRPTDMRLSILLSVLLCAIAGPLACTAVGRETQNGAYDPDKWPWGPFSTSGRHIVNARGDHVTLVETNWVSCAAHSALLGRGPAQRPIIDRSELLCANDSPSAWRPCYQKVCNTLL